MKKLTILSPILAAILLSVLFLASCGGGDDGPTAPGSDAEGDSPAAGGNGRLDSRLFGTWVETEEVEGERRSIFTFREDGSATFSSNYWFPSYVPYDAEWWIESGQLMMALVETFEYAISNGKLTFTAVGNGISFLADAAELGVAFTADGDPGGLTGSELGPRGGTVRAVRAGRPCIGVRFRRYYEPRRRRCQLLRRT